MTFLNPLALFGLVAAGIPIIIHLFNFRKPRRVDFSSLTFLRELRRSTMRRLRIKQWLLLLLRTLIIACLVLAFSRPTIKGSVVGGLAPRAQRSVAIVVDNSLSMSARNQNGDFLTQAREAAYALIETLRPGDEVLVTGTAPPYRAELSTSRSGAAELVDEIQLSPLAIDPRPAITGAAERLSEALHPNREIFFISDFQRTSMAVSQKVDIAPDIQIVLLPVQGSEGENTAVTAATVVTQIVEVGQPVQIEATIRNFSDQARDGYVVSVFLAGDRVAQQVVDLAANSTRSVRFAVTPRQRGWLKGRVEGEEDSFPFDDTHYFTLHIPETRDVLLVRGREAESDYVSLVVSPGSDVERSPFAVTHIGDDDLSTVRFAAYAGIVLVGVDDFTSGEAAALTDYVDQGGGILLFTGANAGSQGYADLLRRLDAGRIGGFFESGDGTTAVASVERFEPEHPLFQGVFDTDDPARLSIEHPEIYRSAAYNPGSGDEQTLVWMSNGRPFLQEITYGRGRVLLFTVLPEPSWSELPVRGLFVPMVFRSLFLLTSGDGATNQHLILGKATLVRIPIANPGGLLRLVSEDGMERVPEQREQFQSVMLTMPDDLEQTGIYEVWAGDRVIRRIAVNLAPEESDLRLMDQSEAAAAVSETYDLDAAIVSGAGAGDARQIAEQIAATRFGIEVWNVFLTLALIFLVTEMLVAMRWRSEAAE